MDETGRVLNAKYAMYRAAQFIRVVCQDPGGTFMVAPDFEDWETEVH